MNSIQTTRLTRLCCAAAALTLSCASPAPAEDWPRWRGPRGDGISQESNLATQWPREGPKTLWTAPVGIGHSSPVAKDGKVYLLTARDDLETLTAFNAADGKVLWEANYKGGWTGQYKGTRATPTIEGDRIYTYGGGTDLACWNLADGSEVWRLNVLQETGASDLTWGAASSPLIDGDRIYVQSGEGGPIAVAVDKKSGKIAWKSQATGKAGYAHPVLIDAGGGSRQLIVFGGEALVAMDPATGKTLWQEPWKTMYDVNATTPIYRDGHLFISSAYGHGSMMLKVTANGAERLWENPSVQARFQPPVLDGDHLYVNSEGTLKCLSWPDGKVVWEGKQRDLRIGNGGSFVRFGGDKLVALSDRGELSLMQATPAGIKLISQTKLIDGREIWATPLIYQGRLYAKGVEELTCLDIAGK